MHHLVWLLFLIEQNVASPGRNHMNVVHKLTAAAYTFSLITSGYQFVVWRLIRPVEHIEWLAPISSILNKYLKI